VEGEERREESRSGGRGTAREREAAREGEGWAADRASLSSDSSSKTVPLFAERAKAAAAATAAE
jgi:hypothetical protein